MYVTLDDWASTIEREYLRDFIPSGGAAVKFVVAPDRQTQTAVRQRMDVLAIESRCQYALVDAGHTRVHMIDQLFFAVSRQIDWDELTRRYVRDVLENERFTIPDDPTALTYRQVAALNQYDEYELRRDLRKALTQGLFRDYAMAQEFRYAMLRLCQAQLEPDQLQLAERDAILQWLRGELRMISALKQALIFQKIGRHNARDMFLSLAHWLRVCGRSGIVLVLDIQRYLTQQRPTDGTLYHTPNTVLDAYEVLRQFIDTTDELEGCFIVVIAPAEFLDDPRRGLEKYAPLQTRISDEVHDRSRANPLSSLIRLYAPDSSERSYG
jgi:hypothetical protein